ncbi:MAG: deoxyguanosinetriphosphate triphosphohydrolase [Clostridiales bacterium]|jgi:dGTPase|nr:deoxyguanosinetriphosphate triphosphohydrolase [Clostridiales bacterium]
MSYIDYIYELEDKFFSEFAFKSKDTGGREREIAPCELRTEFSRDRDRIIHCKSFRRLKHKTQVFLSPEGDHYRTRLTHTLEVSQIARTIARALRLNEDLTEAIALGHDLGHTPFGHAGERALGECYKFEHDAQGLRVVDVLEYDFKGMNLTFEVRDGIRNHTSKGKPVTLEGYVVSNADRIAYINHDIDDAIRGGILKASDIPAQFTSVLGLSHGHRINNMILDVVKNSIGKPQIKMSEPFAAASSGLRRFMFDNVYTESLAKSEESKAVDMLKALYAYFIADTSKLPDGYNTLLASDEQKVCDYIASMTDRYAVSVYERIFLPKGWKG